MNRSKNSILKIFLTLVLGVFLTGISEAQNGNKGKDFWVSFQLHRDGTQAGLFLYITGDSNTTGTVSVPGQSWSTNFAVKADSMTLVAVPNNIGYVNCTNCFDNRAIRVTSSKNIVVYSHIYNNFRSDATLVLPTQTLGKDYYCMGYEQRGTNANNERSVLSVIGAQDSTLVRITPSVAFDNGTGGTLPAGTPYTIFLRKNQVYQVKCKSKGLTEDVTGTFIQVIDTGAKAQCKKIAVFTGSTWTDLGCNSVGGDNLYEQMYPKSSWGYKYITVPSKDRNGDNIRIVAGENGTVVSVLHKAGGGNTYNLNAGQFQDISTITEEKYISSTKPIMVALFFKSQTCDNKTGDPSMTMISPMEQTLKAITLYSSRYEAISKNYINILMATQNTSSFRLDNNPVTWNLVTRNPYYSFAQVQVSQGNHRLKADEGFVATAYGFGSYESYGYAAGANIEDLQVKVNVTNSTTSEEKGVCFGQSTKFTSSANYQVSRYLWKFGDGAIDSVQNPTHKYKAPGKYRVSLYTYKKFFDGCSSFDSTILFTNVYANPKANFITTPTCINDTVFFRDKTVISDAYPVAYVRWDFGNGKLGYDTFEFAKFDTAKTYNVTYQVFTTANCSDTMVMPLKINAKPKVNIGVSKFCYNDSMRFQNLSTVSNGTLKSQVWDFGDLTTDTAKNPRHWYPVSKTYKVKLVTTSVANCTSSKDTTVFKLAKITTQFTYPDSCAGRKIAFKNNSTIDSSTIQKVLWRFGDGKTDTLFSSSNTYANSGTYKVTLISTAFGNCFDSVSRTISVNPGAKASFTQSSVCQASDITFTSTSTITSGSITNTKWLLEGSNLTGSPVSKKFSTWGNHNIQLMLETDKGCKDTLRSTITLFRNPTVNFISKNLCERQGDTVKQQVTMTADTVSSYKWFLNGVSYGTGKNIFVKFNDTGTNRMKLIATVSKGCVDSITKNILVNARPIANYSVADECINNPAQFMNSTSIKKGSVVSYIWSLDEGGTSVLANPSKLYSFAGFKATNLIAISDLGCRDTIAKNFTIYPKPLSRFSAKQTCQGIPTDFNDLSIISTGSIVSSNWLIDGNNFSGMTQSYTFPFAGNFPIQLITQSDLGCYDTTNVNVKINPNPVADFDLDPDEGCAPFLANFTDLSTISSGNIKTYLFDYGDLTPPGFSTSHNYKNPGLYDVNLTVTSDSGCIDTKSYTDMVTVLPRPYANFSYTPDNPSILNPIIEFTDLSVNAVTWDWSANGIPFSTDQNPINNFKDTGTYNVTLSITNPEGCSKDTTLKIFISSDFRLFIPNAFSPNGDGRNDVFRMYGVLQGIRNFEIEIFNRWGERVFFTNDVNQGWDGTYNGAKVQSGVYSFIITFSAIGKAGRYHREGMLNVSY